MSRKFILFDLDDTLYPSETGLLQEVGRRIKLWLCDRLRLTWEDALTMQHDYFIRYGTTLNGLIAERQIDPYDYLAFVHDVPVEQYLQRDPLLAEMLASLPLHRVIYTNATTAHGWRVLDALGVAHCFERIIGIEEVGLRNKLYRDAYERALSLLGAQGAECIMVEDSVRNLQPAKALGMATVLVGPGYSPRERGDETAASEPDMDESIDFAVESVLDVAAVIKQIL